MKIHWFSPLPPDQTEIGNVTARILPVLSKMVEMDVYTGTNRWRADLESHCPIHSIDLPTMNWKKLHLGGLPVYHIGNNIHFHSEIIQTARKCPGIVVLHDLSLHETILNLNLHHGPGRLGYFDALYKWGGEEALQEGRDYLDRNRGDILDISLRYPLFQYVLENAAGVISHNPLNVPRIMEATQAPVLYATLPYEAKSNLHPLVHRTPEENRKYSILFFGFLGGSNRRLRQFLEAFSQSPFRNHFRIDLAGRYPENEVKDWIQKFKLQPYIKLHGFLSDPQLDELLLKADLAVNLRWPSMGEASATLLRTWNFSLPSLVTRTAYYSSLPENTVAFVRPEKELEDILMHLEGFVRKPRRYYGIGLAGRAYLEERHSIEAFSTHFLEFLPEAENWLGNTHLQAFGRALVQNHIASYPDQDGRRHLLAKCADELSKWS